jgi:hypothetical protein
MRKPENVVEIEIADRLDQFRQEPDLLARLALRRRPAWRHSARSCRRNAICPGWLGNSVRKVSSTRARTVDHRDEHRRRLRRLDAGTLPGRWVEIEVAAHAFDGGIGERRRHVEAEPRAARMKKS